jgi:hypothetical protein
MKIFDTMMTTLSSVERRQILVNLLENNSQQVGRDVATGESIDERHNSITLIHVHLPKLEADGFIDWNRKTGEISKGPTFEEITPILEALQSRRTDLPADYLGGGEIAE